MPRARTSTSAATVRVAIVVSRYNATITTPMLDGAIDVFDRRVLHSSTSSSKNLCDIFYAAGSFELIPLVRAAAQSNRYHGVAALSCIIKGQTSHDQHLASAVTNALADITLLTGIPVGLGVLTVNTIAQARERSVGKLGNKGAQTMDALLDSIQELRRIQSVSTQTSRPSNARRTLLESGLHSPGLSNRITTVPDKARSSR